jgi:hypothetical protein
MNEPRPTPQGYRAGRRDRGRSRTPHRQQRPHDQRLHSRSPPPTSSSRSSSSFSSPGQSRSRSWSRTRPRGPGERRSDGSDLSDLSSSSCSAPNSKAGSSRAQSRRRTPAGGGQSHRQHKNHHRPRHQLDSRPHHGQAELVVRDPYVVEAPPRAYRRGSSLDSRDDWDEYTVPYEGSSQHRSRQGDRRETARNSAARGGPDAGTLLAAAVVLFSILLCWDECCGDEN